MDAKLTNEWTTIWLRLGHALLALVGAHADTREAIMAAHAHAATVAQQLGATAGGRVGANVSTATEAFVVEFYTLIEVWITHGADAWELTDAARADWMSAANNWAAALADMIGQRALVRRAAEFAQTRRVYEAWIEPLQVVLLETIMSHAEHAYARAFEHDAALLEHCLAVGRAINDACPPMSEQARRLLAVAGRNGM